MNKDGNLKFITILLILLFILLCLLIVFLNSIKKQQNTSNQIEIVAEDTSQTIKSIVEKYESEYLSLDGSTIYINFIKDLYDENGKSNNSYFEKFIKELEVFYEDDTFYLVDNKKAINITVKYDYATKEHKIIYNGIENFYGETNGESYVAVDNVKITKYTLIFDKDYYLQMLYMKGGYFSDIKDSLGEGIEDVNGYTNFLNNTISIRTAPNGVVKNIIYKNGYDENELITDGITISSSLEDVYNKYGEPSFGSISDKFLGYRTNSWYYFFYDDEISIYPYAYKDNTKFEKLLKEYIETKDINNFVNNLIFVWKNYDSFVYDKENQIIYLLYASRGVEISFNGSNSDGITLYTNYFFTDKTKSYVKNGFVKLNDTGDLINIIESKRRDGSLVIE